MATYTDPFVASQWLYSTLNVSAVTTLATGGIHWETPPASADVPYVVISMPAAQDDLRVVGAIKIWSPEFWDVIAVGQNLQRDTVDKIAAAVDLLLDRGSGTPTNGTVFECTRERPITFTEINEGIQYVYIGGTYLVKVKATS